MELPFSWVIVKPFIKPKDPEKEQEEAEKMTDNSTAVTADFPSERVQDIESAFSVEPEKGVLGANMTSQFTVIYAPPEVGVHFSIDSFTALVNF